MPDGIGGCQQRRRDAPRFIHQKKARTYFLSARLQLPREGSKAGNKKLLTEESVVNRIPALVTVATDENGEPTAAEVARYRSEAETTLSIAPFYSQLERVLEAKMPNAASPAQVRAIIDPSKGSGQTNYCAAVIVLCGLGIEVAYFLPRITARTFDGNNSARGQPKARARLSNSPSDTQRIRPSILAMASRPMSQPRRWQTAARAA